MGEREDQDKKSVESVLAEFAASDDGADRFMVDLFFEWVDGNMVEGQVLVDSQTGGITVQAPLRADGSIWMGLRNGANKRNGEAVSDLSLFLNSVPIKWPDQKPFCEYAVKGRADYKGDIHSRPAIISQLSTVIVANDWTEHAQRASADLTARFRIAEQSRAY